MTFQNSAPDGASCDNQFQAIYLGDVDANKYIDASEWKEDTESAGHLTGTVFGSESAPLSQNLFTITANDENCDGKLNGENGGFWGHNGYYETFTTDRPVDVDGGQASTFDFDGVAQFKAKITYENGTTVDAKLTIIQDTCGRTFVVPSLTESLNAPLEAGPIQCIKIGKVVNDWGTSNNLDVCRPDWHGVPCFVEGTRLLTPNGQRSIENLAVGDLVETADHGAQVVRWHGVRTLDAVDLDARPNLRPIRISRGALGDRLPKRDLLVSPQHRMIVRSTVAQELFGVDEVLVAAKHLLSLDGVEVADDLAEVRYHHVLFDRHEVVFAEGAASESLYTGKQALKMVGEAARTEILSLFPELENTDEAAAGARIFLSGREGRALAQRHAGVALQ